MRETEYKTRRLVATTPEEKRVIKSWGAMWSRFGVLERTGKPILLIFGDWSGYRSSQYRITHIAAAPKGIAEDYCGTVQFTDNTTMSVWVKKVTRKEIMCNYEQRQSYTDLIRKLIDSGNSFYKV